MQFKEYFNTTKIGLQKKNKREKETEQNKTTTRKNFYNFREIVRVDDIQNR